MKNMKKIILILFKNGDSECIYGKEVTLSNNEIVISSNYGLHSYKSNLVDSVTSVDESEFLEYEKIYGNNQRKQKNNK